MAAIDMAPMEQQPMDATMDPDNTEYMGATGESGLEGFELDSHVINAHPRLRISEEAKLEAQVTRRRQMELERRARIFDAKRRTIGVDKPKLDAQVVEKQRLSILQKQMDKVADREMLRFDKQLKISEIEKQRARKDMARECKEFSLQHLNFESRREFDLNDPLANRKGLPARLGDDDPRCGPSGLQKFNGEDLFHEERIRQQRRAQVDFIEQQKFEKAMLAKMSAGADGHYANEMSQLTALRDEIEAGEVSLRKELQKSQQDTNLDKARENNERRTLDEHLISEANAKELEHHATDTFLNETGAHNNPNGRVRRDAYKGSSRLERVQVRQLQEGQMDQKMQRQADENYNDKRFAMQAEQTRKQQVMMEREKQRAYRARAEQIAQENHGIRDDQKNGVGATVHRVNEVHPSFFAQFGTSTR